MDSKSSTEILIPKKSQERENNSRVRSKIQTDKNVSVIYYLSRNGHLEHPHFMEVPLSSSPGLYLIDVVNRLNFLRGKGMANMYSWSSKRSYRNGFVWHDLSENDLIQPSQGGEYVLKGSELLRSSLSFRYCETTGSSELLPETEVSGDDNHLPATMSRKNQSWSTFEKSHVYRVYKADSSGELVGKAADASTQTGDERRRKRSGREENQQCGETISREDAFPTSSNSSSEVLQCVSRSAAVDQTADFRDRTANEEHPSGRMNPSRVLKQFVTCGSFAVKDFEST
ncbi:hypothetical protein U1Q18_026122 [Sarracenia purpurea var. burkii]